MGRAIGERAMAERPPDDTEDFGLPLMLWAAGAAEAPTTSAGVAKASSIPQAVGVKRQGWTRAPHWSSTSETE